MGPPASHRVSRVRWYSGYTATDLHFAYGTITLYGVSFQTAFTMQTSYYRCPQPQRQVSGLGSSPFARRYLGNRGFFLFLRVLRCFSSPGYLLHTYGFSMRYVHITVRGLPHSDICGSMDICSSPQLFAACHVLRRLLVPRHPPYALIHLT